jgi:hypothetical protein
MRTGAATAGAGARGAARPLLPLPMSARGSRSTRGPRPLRFKPDDSAAVVAAEFKNNAGLARLLRGYSTSCKGAKLEPIEYQVGRRRAAGGPSSSRSRSRSRSVSSRANCCARSPLTGP